VAKTALSPSGFVAELERNGRITGSRGGSETIGGYAAWVGQLSVTGQNNTQLVYAAAFIRKSADQMFQILARTASPGDADEARILGAARSLGGLTDARRLQPRPARVDVVSVRQAGEFGTVVPGFGPQGLELADTAILNNAFLDQTVRTGELLKIVTPATLK